MSHIDDAVIRETAERQRKARNLRAIHKVASAPEPREWECIGSASCWFEVDQHGRECDRANGLQRVGGAS